MTRHSIWVPSENGALAALYFAMLDKAIAGEKYNKAAMIRNQRTIGDHLLCARSRGSIEFKLMNASAAHGALIPGATTMHGYGYRCLPNFQKGLKTAMQSALIVRGALPLTHGSALS